jgi:glycosyltransferase involved in cell wall biosynthesis
MIVKNESKIIKRLFDSVSNIIDSYCICDTGSTDGTPEIIKEYFDAKGIEGKVYTEQFRDFGYNRTHSLLACAGMANADYILLMDADMILETGSQREALDITRFKHGLPCAVAHYVFQGSPTMSYKNVRIVKNNIGIKYWGVTHEVIETPPNSVYSGIGKELLFINDVGDGGAKADKYERDIRLLLCGLEDKPNNDRYTFYLANSYRENGDKQKAIETYKKRIEIGGWIEEIWQSYYNIGKCYQSLGEHEKALANWLDGYDRFPDRLENIYEMMNYYRNNSKHRLVYELYKMVKDRLDKTRGKLLDHLFVQNDIYDYKIDYEYTIAGYYCNPDAIDVAALCMRVLGAPTVDHGIINNVLSNYKFYAESIKKNCRSLAMPIMTKTYDTLKNSTPSMCYLDGHKILINVRHVNYMIDDKGGYVNQDKIETRNMMTVYDRKTGAIEKEFELDYNRELDNLYVGLEDVRLFEQDGKPYFTANRGLGKSTGKGSEMSIEFGTINLETGKTESSILKKTDGMNAIEKNWTLFAGVDQPKVDKRPHDALKIVYGWYPFTVYDPDKGKVILQNCSSLPPFFKDVRGSCNGIAVGSETWFLCHTVSYEDRRHYYHIIIALDTESCKVKRWTKYFSFEGKSVEYALGFLYDTEYDDFLLGYSVMDRTTEVVKIYKRCLDALFV